MSQPSKFVSLVFIFTFLFITAAPLQAETTNINSTIPGFDCYRDSQSIDQRLNELRIAYPDLVQISEIGTSVEGRAIKLIKISKENGEQNKPRLILISGLREIPLRRLRSTCSF